MWDVIIWELENAVDFVPSSWGNNERNAYKYPIGVKEQRVRAIIYDCKDLQTNYKVCSAKCLKRDIKDLKKAQEYCKKGEVTSNVETDESESTSDTNKNSSGRRSKKRKTINDDYAYDSVVTDSEDDDEHQTHQPRKKFSFPNHNTSVTTYPSCRNGSFHDSPSSLHQNDGIIDERTSCKSVTPTHFHRNASNNNTPLYTPGSFRSGPSYQNSDTIGSAGSKNNVLSDSEKILRELRDIKFEIKELKSKMDKMENNRAAVVPDTSPVDYFITNVPCENEETIQELEEGLKNPETYQQLVAVLYLCGGETLHKSIYLMMGKLLGREVSLQYSCQGKKKKRAFCHLLMFKALTQAIRKRFEVATDTEIKKEVSLYLAASKNRLPPSKRDARTVVEEQEQLNF